MADSFSPVQESVGNLLPRIHCKPAVMCLPASLMGLFDVDFSSNAAIFKTVRMNLSATVKSEVAVSPVLYIAVKNAAVASS